MNITSQSARVLAQEFIFSNKTELTKQILEEIYKKANNGEVSLDFTFGEIRDEQTEEEKETIKQLQILGFYAAPLNCIIEHDEDLRVIVKIAGIFIKW